MTKLTRLLSLLLVILMLVATLVACGGETPDVTEPDATEPEATEPDTTAPPVTTEPPETTEPEPVTTEPVVTDPPTTEPEIVIVPAEPELEAAEHTEHVWFSHPTYTAYDAPKEDGTLGYVAVHCRYAGCDAIEGNKIQPVLAYLDFENFNGTLAEYVKAQPNVDQLNKSPSTTKGTVGNGMWYGGATSQNIIEFQPGWQHNTQYYFSIDIQIATNPQGGKNLQLPTIGLTSQVNATRYLFQIGKRDSEDGKYYGHQNFAKVYPLDGFVLEQGKWYRLEQIFSIGDGSLLKYESNPEAILYYSPGTTTVFLTELERAADGTMIPTGNRNIVGIFDGMGAMYDDKTFTELIMDTSVIKFDSYRMLGAFDNVIVATTPIDKP